MAFLPPFRIVQPQGYVAITLEVFEEDGRKVCGIFALRGKIMLPPRQWLRTVREELRRIERMVARHGCDEIRIAGRDWRRIFPDYESCPGIENGLRKALNNGFKHADLDLLDGPGEQGCQRLDLPVVQGDQR